MVSTSVYNLVESSENLTIPPIGGKPTYTTIHYLHGILNSNVASVCTNLGCNNMINLCLTLYPNV